jgi:hypothetical protein
MKLEWNRDPISGCLVAETRLGTFRIYQRDDGWFGVTTPAESFHMANGIDTAKSRCESRYSELVEIVATESGYIRLEPGQVVVDKVLHELALSMAHKWERICDGEELADVAGEGE